jgi:hypothetical protein
VPLIATLDFLNSGLVSWRVATTTEKPRFEITLENAAPLCRNFDDRWPVTLGNQPLESTANNSDFRRGFGVRENLHAYLSAFGSLTEADFGDAGGSAVGAA